MARGHAAKRESKKPKKNAKKAAVPSSVFADQEVQLIRKPKKPKEEEL
jgi:hypothetical protein